MPSKPNANRPEMLIWAFLPFAVLWIGFSLYGFVLTTRSGYEYQRRRALIDAGKVARQTLYVTWIERDPSEDSTGWDIGLNSSYPSPKPLEAYRSTSSREGLALGMALEAYQFDDDWLIPRFDRGGQFWMRWVVLAIGIVPPVVVVLVGRAVIRSRRRRAAEAEAALAEGTLDPAMFVIGEGSYSNLDTTTAYLDAWVYRIDPARLPVLQIVVINLLIAGFFYGFHWLMKNKATGDAGPWLVYGLPLGMGLLTCGGFTLLVVWETVKAQRLGPWFIYDRASGRVELPRSGLAFEKREVEHLQYITTRKLRGDGTSDGERVSELNLVTCREGQRERWPILRSSLDGKPFDRLLKPLVAETHLPVMRVRDDRRGWEVSEMPYDRW